MYSVVTGCHTCPYIVSPLHWLHVAPCYTNLACIFACKVMYCVNVFSMAVIASMKSSIGITFVSILALHSLLF